MRIDRLKFTSRFKNLQPGFEIDFDVSKGHSITVVVGRNGTGKSNILEALVLIFRDLDLGPRLADEKKPPFSYELVYTVNNCKVEVQYNHLGATNSERYTILVEDDEWGAKKFSINQFSSDIERPYLPKYVFGYYSGPSNRLEEHFAEHQKRFYDNLLKQKSDEDAPPARPLLYARLIHSQFALLAFFLEEDKEISNFLEEHLRIVGLDSVLFILKTPEWALTSSSKREDKYWTVTGTVRFFMERLYKYALAPFRHQNPNSNKKNDDYFYLYIPDQPTLQKLAQEYIAVEGTEGETSFQSFFKALESTYISDLIYEVRINVQVRNVDGSLTFRELSEGEQQLLMVLGLLRFTKEDESLFLLDEPDTHLNPAWSVKYLKFIEDIVGQTNSSQLIMNTHNPLTLASLEKEQVMILYRDEETTYIKSEQAESDPRGMGVAGILTSDIFGLRSTLDLETLDDLDRQRRLIIKSEDEGLSEDEEIELNRLNEELKDIDATRFVRDPYYALFVKNFKRYEMELGDTQSRALTPEELEERDRVALEILNDIFGEADEA